MSNSTDSLKKKVCVTVFLDELFEEVLDEDWKDLKQVRSEVTDSEVTTEEKQLKEPLRLSLDNEKKVKVSPNTGTDRIQVQFRPRKHRRESKFSKNHCDSFKNELTKYGKNELTKYGKNELTKYKKDELTKYGCGSRGQTENERCGNVDSAGSDSDLDLDDNFELDKWAAENSRSSFSEPNDVDMTDESFLSLKSPVCSMKIAYPKARKNSQSKLNSRTQSSLSICNKSTQFDGSDSGEGEHRHERIGDDVRFDEEPLIAEENALAWNKTKRQIHLILAKNRHMEKEACEGDRVRHYDLRSILEECVKTEEIASSKGGVANLDGVFPDSSPDCPESDEYDLSDSYTRVLPHNTRKTKARGSEVKRVWTSSQRMDGFESDLSEGDCTHCSKSVGLQSFHDDSMLCYTMRLKCKDCVSEISEKQNGNLSATDSVANSETTSRESSFESVKSKGSREADPAYRTVVRSANIGALRTKLKAEKEIRNEGDLLTNTEKSLPAAEGRNKNFAEGDTFEKPLNRNPKFILDVEAKEKMFVCDEILKHVVESNVIRNEIVVNRAEIEFDSAQQAKTEAKTASLTAPEELAEVFFKKNQTGSLEKNMMDVESEMVFAESENFYDNEDFFGLGFPPSLPVRASAQPNDVCVVEFEDRLSRSRILRRMKTVEILGDSSLSDMKNISTEVILICENISNNEVCLEAWQSSASTLKSLTEMGQCYLKDSKDSAMYLIEIPLHFIHADKKKFSDSEHLFKAPDSD